MIQPVLAQKIASAISQRISIIFHLGSLHAFVFKMCARAGHEEVALVRSAELRVQSCSSAPGRDRNLGRLKCNGARVTAGL